MTNGIENTSSKQSWYYLSKYVPLWFLGNKPDIRLETKIALKIETKALSAQLL